MKTRDNLVTLQNQFISQVQAKNYSVASSIFDYVGDLLSNLTTNTTWIDLENYRNSSIFENDLSDWLNDPKIKNYYGADPNATWVDFVNAIYYDFYSDISQSYISNLSFILSQKIYDIKVVIYNGQDDVLVNSNGVERYLPYINWSNIPQFLAAKKQIWRDTNGYVIGSYKHYDKLTYVTVNKAGHSVPADQPWSARDMLRRFIKNIWDK